VPRAVKTAVQRPGANEGGREEEEKRSGIAVRRPDGLHNREISPMAPGFSAGRTAATDARRRSSDRRDGLA
jgi:hypothetical protein